MPIQAILGEEWAIYILHLCTCQISSISGTPVIITVVPTRWLTHKGLPVPRCLGLGSGRVDSAISSFWECVYTCKTINQIISVKNPPLDTWNMLIIEREKICGSVPDINYLNNSLRYSFSMFRRSLTKANFPQNKTRQFLNLPFQAQEGEPLSGSSLKIRMEGKSLVCGFRKTWAVALSLISMFL